MSEASGPPAGGPRETEPAGIPGDGGVAGRNPGDEAAGRPKPRPAATPPAATAATPRADQPVSRSADQPAPQSGEQAEPPPAAVPARRRLFIDLTPLRLDGQFRLLWGGQLISVMGNQITRIALPYQVYVLTGSPLAIAVLTTAQLLPLLFLSLGAGAIADAFDRRRVLMLTQTGIALADVGLIIASSREEVPLWAIYALAGIVAGLLAIDWPTRTSAVPRLVPRERLPAAIALNQINIQATQIIGPAFGGLVLAILGPVGAYGADLVTCGLAFGALVLLRPIPPLHLVAAPGLRAIGEGLSFVRSRPAIVGSFVIDINAMVFAMPTGLFAPLAIDVFHTGAPGVGALASALAAGAFLGALTSGWISSVTRIGRAIFLAVVGWGVAITLFGLATFSFELALVFLALAGLADVISAMLRATLVQVETPDHLRGRISSIHVMSVASGPRVGDIRATSLAALVGPQVSVVVGGLVCLAGAAVTLRAFPALASHRLRLLATDAELAAGPDPGASGGASPGGPASPGQPAASSGE